MRPTTNPVLAALAQARMRAAPMFVKWCELNGLSPWPATPAHVAQFVADCAPLGVERLWPAIQEISRLHVSAGLADPTLGGVAATVISDLANIDPPRSWPGNHKQRFRSLPYDLQVYVAAHEAQREKALRRAQNEAAASARHKLASYRKNETRPNEESKADENDTQSTASGSYQSGKG
jgi:hypothetical protein